MQLDFTKVCTTFFLSNHQAGYFHVYILSETLVSSLNCVKQLSYGYEGARLLTNEILWYHTLRAKI